MPSFSSIMLTILLGLGQHDAVGTPPARPVYETEFHCNIALALASKQLMKLYLDPKKFECVPVADKWTIRGRLKP